MKQKNPKDTQNFITSKKHIKEILKYTNISKQDNRNWIRKRTFYQGACGNESMGECH